MKLRRRFWIGLALGCAAEGLLGGCNPLHPLGLRSHGAPPPGQEARAEEAGAEAGSSEVNKGFFKPTRRPAGMSSEARDIEDSLGVGR